MVSSELVSSELVVSNAKMRKNIVNCKKNWAFQNNSINLTANK